MSVRTPRLTPALLALLALTASACQDDPAPKPVAIELLSHYEAQEAIQKQYDSDLEYLSQIESTGETHRLYKEMLGEFSGSSAAQWIRSRVTQVIYWQKLGTSAGYDETPAGAAINLSNHETDRHTDPNDPESPFEAFPLFTVGLGPSHHRSDRITRILSLFHVARHSEGYEADITPVDPPEYPGAPHAQCPKEFEIERLRGLYVCESTLIGAYTYGAILARELADHCKSCSLAEKSSAKEFYMNALLRHTNPEHRMRIAYTPPKPKPNGDAAPGTAPAQSSSAAAPSASTGVVPPPAVPGLPTDEISAPQDSALGASGSSQPPAILKPYVSPQRIAP